MSFAISFLMWLISYNIINIIDCDFSGDVYDVNGYVVARLRVRQDRPEDVNMHKALSSLEKMFQTLNAQLKMQVK